MAVLEVNWGRGPGVLLAPSFDWSQETVSLKPPRSAQSREHWQGEGVCVCASKTQGQEVALRATFPMEVISSHQSDGKAYLGTTLRFSAPREGNTWNCLHTFFKLRICYLFKTDNNKCWWRCGKVLSHIAGRSVNSIAAVENSLRSSSES